MLKDSIGASHGPLRLFTFDKYISFWIHSHGLLDTMEVFYMAQYKVDFSMITWKVPMACVRLKANKQNGKQLRLVKIVFIEEV